MICKKRNVEVTNLISLKQDNLSVKVCPEMPKKLDIPSGSMGPTDKDVMAQLNFSHPLESSELKVCDF
jgi:hypothetical protein